MFIEGVPLMLLEFAIGQKMRSTAVNLWKGIHPALFGVGICCISVSLFLSVYYVVVIAWCIFYLFSSMQSELPWQGKELCTKYDAYNALKSQADALSSNVSHYQAMTDKNASIWNVLNTTKSKLNQTQFEINNFADCCVIDPQQWYFYTKALEVSTDIEDYSNGLNWKLVGCFILAWIIVYICVIKGIKSTGKAVYFTATFPYIILLILFFRGVTLEGAGNGLKTFFTPEV
ncbi:sodium-dependent neutral amino acid transporter B(0)AT1-like isoform X2 [Paramuricea clavata]|uniref:Sodium-dependent neutral amino acid transporter B(0)AT1-like isoform X2 n=2 Tax=Paramuricea clavata TaxID=317549 RepID=A0A7D9ECI5_PARCT|nr:sodium-dependent neutral amino acid transporter B(0)AT1-like isoform X2 [Paramuricea clavata]